MKRVIKASTDWHKYDDILDKYLPSRGEGDTVAEQVVTATNRIIFRWFNDGDMYDNHWAYGVVDSFEENLPNCANWLYNWGPHPVEEVLYDVFDCESESDYEQILENIAEICFDEEWLSSPQGQHKKEGTIYDCEGPFSVEDTYDEEDDEWY